MLVNAKLYHFCYKFLSGEFSPEINLFWFCPHHPSPPPVHNYWEVSTTYMTAVTNSSIPKMEFVGIMVWQVFRN